MQNRSTSTGAVERRSAKAAPRDSRARRPGEENSRGLLVVGLFKMSKAIFFGALAGGALHLIHRNFGELVMRAINDVPHMDPEGRLASLIMDKADMVGSHQLRQAGMLSFGYACVCVVEGTGLLLHKVWAEYFTIVLTAAALPWEVFELIRDFSWFKVGLMFLNVLVLIYLLWLVRRMRTRQSEEAMTASA
jgi:uncharacterized membrane protein (DUF2068 family)